MNERTKINRIKIILEDQGRTQTWLAKKMGQSFPTINGWCNNKKQPYLSDLIRVAELLEVAPVDLIVDGAKKGKGQTKSLTFTEFN